MCSLKCCTLAIPVLAVLAALAFSTALDGQVWDLLPGWRIPDMPDQSGKVVIVTGPTVNGIGFESAVELARKGAHVVLAGRSKSKGQEALATLKKELPEAKADFAILDLGSFASIKAFADEFLARKLPLHVLLNSAGVMMNPFTLTTDGYESQFATNHLGHYLLTRLLLPVLESSAPSRVITVSSAAAGFPDAFSKAAAVLPADWLPANVTKKIDFSENLGADYEAAYSPTLAYGRSKLANILFARTLARRMEGKKVYSNSCHPGGIATNLGRHFKSDIAKNRGDGFVANLESVVNPLILTPTQGAVTQLYLATAPEVETQDIRGKYYRPQAIQGSEPPSVGEELEEHLWEVSEKLVKDYL